MPGHAERGQLRARREVTEISEWRAALHLTELAEDYHVPAPERCVKGEQCGETEYEPMMPSSACSPAKGTWPTESIIMAPPAAKSSCGKANM
jgi:hypothetical protein